jgi:hypothetical protein
MGGRPAGRAVDIQRLTTALAKTFLNVFQVPTNVEIRGAKLHVAQSVSKKLFFHDKNQKALQ